MRPQFRQEFQLIGKDAEVQFNNETAAQAKVPTYWKRRRSLIL